MFYLGKIYIYIYIFLLIHEIFLFLNRLKSSYINKINKILLLKKLISKILRLPPPQKNLDENNDLSKLCILRLTNLGKSIS